MTAITLDEVRDKLDHLIPKEVCEPEAIQAAVAMVLAPGDEGNLGLLLLKRAERSDDPWSGQIALPGGRKDHSDPSMLATALRETWEETGILLAPDQFLGQLDDVHPDSRNLPSIVVRPFAFGLDHRPEVSLNAESEESLWVGLSELPGTAASSSIEVRQRRLDVFGYRLGPHLLWGMTERIVTPFLEIVLGENPRKQTEVEHGRPLR